MQVAKFLPVGPLVHTPSVAASIKNSGPQGKALEWLDNQPPASVLYIAFGTMANIPAPLVLELARGLELSGVRFLWVLRLSDSVLDVSTVLPPGFLVRHPHSAAGSKLTPNFPLLRRKNFSLIQPNKQNNFAEVG